MSVENRSWLVVMVRSFRREAKNERGPGAQGGRFSWGGPASGRWAPSAGSRRDRPVRGSDVELGSVPEGQVHSGEAGRGVDEDAAHHRDERAGEGLPLDEARATVAD